MPYTQKRERPKGRPLKEIDKMRKMTSTIQKR